MRALVEEVSATLGAITLLLDAWYMKGYLIIDALTRDAIVIGQATPPCMSRHHRENQDGPASTASQRRSSRRSRKRKRNCRSMAAPFARRLQGPLPRRSSCPSGLGIDVRRWQMESGTASAVH